MASFIGTDKSNMTSCDTLPEIDSEGKTFCDKQEVFAEPHIITIPERVSYKETFKTKKDHYSCWRSQDDNKVILGGFENACITVLNKKGKEHIFKLLKGSTVVSGVAITDIKHLVCTSPTNLGVRADSLFTVNIDKDLTPDTDLHPINNLDITNPRCIFIVTKTEYGVLCDAPKRVEFFTLKNILMDTNSSNTGSITLDFPHPDKRDTACSTPDGIIYVASWRSVVYAFNNVGHPLGVYGEKSGMDDNVKPGLLFDPLSIQYCGGSIVVTCWRGDVHILRDGKWTLLMASGNGTGGSLFVRKKTLWRAVFSETRFWAVDYDDERKTHVYKLRNP